MIKNKIKIKLFSVRFGIVFAIYISKHTSYETTIEINQVTYQLTDRNQVQVGKRT